MKYNHKPEEGALIGRHMAKKGQQKLQKQTNKQRLQDSNKSQEYTRTKKGFNKKYIYCQKKNRETDYQLTINLHNC